MEINDGVFLVGGIALLGYALFQKIGGQTILYGFFTLLFGTIFWAALCVVLFYGVKFFWRWRDKRVKKSVARILATHARNKPKEESEERNEELMLEEPVIPERDMGISRPVWDLILPVFDARVLHERERALLLQNDYEEHSFVIPGEVRQRPFLVRPSKRESVLHVFLVNAVVREVQKYTMNIAQYETVHPDIVFEINGCKHAIEVETGYGLSKHKTRLWEKKELNDRDYGKNWYFLVAQSNLARSYQKYATVIRRKELPIFIQRLCVGEVRK